MSNDIKGKGTPSTDIARSTGRTSRGIMTALLGAMLGANTCFVTTRTAECESQCEWAASQLHTVIPLLHRQPVLVQVSARSITFYVDGRRLGCVRFRSLEERASWSRWDSHRETHLHTSFIFDHHAQALEEERATKAKREDATKQIVALMREHGFSVATVSGDEWSVGGPAR